MSRIIASKTVISAVKGQMAMLVLSTVSASHSDASRVNVNNQLQKDPCRRSIATVTPAYPMEDHPLPDACTAGASLFKRAPIRNATIRQQALL